MKDKMEMTHPMVHNAQRLSEEGILVFHNVKGLPTGDKPFVSPDYVISITHKGIQEIMYDNTHRIAIKRTVAVLYPNHSLKVQSQTDDFLNSLIVVSKDILNEPLLQVIVQHRYRFESNPDVKLDEHEYKILASMANVMDETSHLDIADKRVLMIRQLEFFMRILSHYRSTKLKEANSGRIVEQFQFNLKQHARQHRDVLFYAQQACLSTKHFSTVIKEATGHTAANWIHTQVVAEAKMLLHMRRDLTVQAIADMLGFDEQATFSRYFKRETGISPTDYRNQEWIQPVDM